MKTYGLWKEGNPSANEIYCCSQIHRFKVQRKTVNRPPIPFRPTFPYFIASLIVYTSFVPSCNTFPPLFLWSVTPSFLHFFLPTFHPFFLSSFLLSFLPFFLPSFLPSFLSLSLLPWRIGIFCLTTPSLEKDDWRRPPPLFSLGTGTGQKNTSALELAVNCECKHRHANIRSTLMRYVTSLLRLRLNSNRRQTPANHCLRLCGTQRALYRNAVERNSMLPTTMAAGNASHLSRRRRLYGQMWTIIVANGRICLTWRERDRDYGWP